MSNSLAHRDPSSLVFADFNDRRRLAVSELAMHAEDGVFSLLTQGQVILKHVVATGEVTTMGDAIQDWIRRAHRH